MFVIIYFVLSPLCVSVIFAAYIAHVLRLFRFLCSFCQVGRKLEPIAFLHYLLGIVELTDVGKY